MEKWESDRHNRIVYLIDIIYSTRAYNNWKIAVLKEMKTGVLHNSQDLCIAEPQKYDLLGLGVRGRKREF